MVVGEGGLVYQGAHYSEKVFKNNNSTVTINSSHLK